MSEMTTISTLSPAPGTATSTATPVVVLPTTETVPSASPGDTTPVVSVPKGAPERYEDFKVPSGVSLNAKALDDFKGLAKTHSLSQEQAQALVTFQTDFVKGEIEAYEAQLATDKAAIPGLIAKDPELGGRDTVAKVATMQRAVEAFGGAGFKKMLDGQGPEVYMEIARFAYKVGSAIKEDSVAGTSGAPGPVEKRAADVLFGAKT